MTMLFDLISPCATCCLCTKATADASQQTVQRANTAIKAVNGGRSIADEVMAAVDALGAVVQATGYVVDLYADYPGAFSKLSRLLVSGEDLQLQLLELLV